MCVVCDDAKLPDDELLSLLQATQREAETQAAVEEVEIKNMELQMQKKLFEQVVLVIYFFVILYRTS